MGSEQRGQPWSGGSRVHTHTHVNNLHSQQHSSPSSALPQLIAAPGRSSSALPNLTPISSHCSGGSRLAVCRWGDACSSLPTLLLHSSTGAYLPMCLSGAPCCSTSPLDCALHLCPLASPWSNTTVLRRGWGGRDKIQVCPGNWFS